MLAILSFFPWATYDGTHTLLSPLWQWTFIFIGFVTLGLNIAYFINANNPYSSYYLSFTTNIVGGILIMAGHEKAVSKYQDKNTSAVAAIVLYTTSALSLVLAIASNVVWNTGKFNDHMTLSHFGTWLAYVIIVITGASFSVFYDLNYNQRRRYIAFLRRKNMTIEYKTKSLHAYRTYQKSGNAHKFLEKNIELLEKSLDVDRKQIIDKK